MKEQGNVTISTKCQNLIPQCNSHQPAETEVAWRRCLQVGFAKEKFEESNISAEVGLGVLWVFSLWFLCSVFIFLSLPLSGSTKFFRIILVLLFLLTPREVGLALLKSNYDVLLIISLIVKDHKWLLRVLKVLIENRKVGIIIPYGYLFFFIFSCILRECYLIKRTLYFCFWSVWEIKVIKFKALH